MTFFFPLTFQTDTSAYRGKSKSQGDNQTSVTSGVSSPCQLQGDETVHTRTP